MRKILALALGFTVATGCDFYESQFEEWSNIDTAYYGAPMQFARGDSLQDQSTLWGDTHGFALGSDRYGAVGMVGMVCSFATQDGFLRMDMDPDDGDELVVDAVAMENGFATLSVDGGQVTLTEFPSEWDGAISVDVQVEEPPADAALTDDHIVALIQGENCRIDRLDRTTGEAVSSTELQGACTSNVATDASTGTVYVSTSVGTFGAALDGTTSAMGAPADFLAWGDGLLAKGLTDTRTISVWNGSVLWSRALEGGTLVSLDFITGGRLVAGLSGNTQGALMVIDAATGDLIEDVRTEVTFSHVGVSPEGGTLAVRSGTALHMVRVVQ